MSLSIQWEKKDIYKNRGIQTKRERVEVGEEMEN
jgi:hypothetical protein